MTEQTSILIPAHNEATVIGETLTQLLGPDQKLPSGWQIIVVANGCTDNTAQIVRDSWPDITLVELPEPSKVNAMRHGMALVRPGPVIILDADISVTIDALGNLVAPLLNETKVAGAVAAVGRFEPDVAESDFWVRLFYRVWRLHPYFDGGKFGGCYALAERVQSVITTMPEVINDDEFVARAVIRQGDVCTTNCVFATRAPRTAGELIRVRSRVQRGNRQLRQLGESESLPPVSGMQNNAKSRFFKRLLRRPLLWPAALVYVGINGLATLRNKRRSFGTAQSNAAAWERVSR